MRIGLEEFYETNEDFREWTDKAAISEHKTKKEILESKMAAYVAGYYEDRGK